MDRVLLSNFTIERTVVKFGELNYRDHHTRSLDVNCSTEYSKTSENSEFSMTIHNPTH